MYKIHPQLKHHITYPLKNKIANTDPGLLNRRLFFAHMNNKS